ncbi:MAG: type IV pilin protein [Rubrivivax sp.]
MLRPKTHASGFTLIELMIAVAVVAILTAVALPAYTAYVQRSKVPVALDALSSLATRMEQCFQDTNSYTNCAACGSSKPTAANFTIACTVPSGGATFSATATGSGSMTNYTYTIDSSGNRTTTAHPKGPNTTCWTTRGTTCDT